MRLLVTRPGAGRDCSSRRTASSMGHEVAGRAAADVRFEDDPSRSTSTAAGADRDQPQRRARARASQHLAQALSPAALRGRSGHGRDGAGARVRAGHRGTAGGQGPGRADRAARRRQWRCRCCIWPASSWPTISPASCAGSGFMCRSRWSTRAKRRPSLDARDHRAISRREIDGVLLMSPQTARTYARLINAHGLVEVVARHRVLLPVGGRWRTDLTAARWPTQGCGGRRSQTCKKCLP